MFPKIGIIIIHTIVWLYVVNFSAYAQDIELPPPQKSGGMPLMEAINNRKSIRDFCNKEIPIQVLSDLLWAACGINRPQDQKITVPSAGNVQNISVYVAKADGLYLYDATNHRLELILNEDVRAEIGMQRFKRDAPVKLVYVADLSILLEKMSGVSRNTVESFSMAHTGFISQNVYLFCASFGLATVVHGQIEYDDAYKAIMKLEADEEIMLMQSIGYPEESLQINMKNNDPYIYSLSQNYPNPFNPSTAIKYTLKKSSDVTLKICNLSGQEIEVLFKGFQAAGEYEIIWQPKGLASGIYFYSLQTDNFSETKKLLLQK